MSDLNTNYQDLSPGVWTLGGGTRMRLEDADGVRPRVLVGGIGNIFMGDDAFGVETVRQLMQRHLPKEVQVVDFGIRGYDLGFALAAGYEFIILVDTAARGQPPGTLFLIEPEVEAFDPAEVCLADGHNLTPMRVLQMARRLEQPPERLYLVGCEPAVLDAEDGHLGLSPAVQAAVPRAIQMIEELLEEVLKPVKP